MLSKSQVLETIQKTLSLFKTSILDDEYSTKDFAKSLVPHTISETVIFTVTEMDENRIKLLDSTPQYAYIRRVDTDFSTYDPNKSYFVRYANKDYPLMLLDNYVMKCDTTDVKLTIEPDSISTYAQDVDGNIIIFIYRLNGSPITDLQLITKEVQYLENQYLEKDLSVVNNLTVGGKIVQYGTPINDEDVATKKYVDDTVAGIVDSAPETLDTLQELATALGNDANFATTMTNSLANKADKDHVHTQYLTEHQDLSEYAKTADLPDSVKLVPDNYTVTNFANDTVRWVTYNLNEMQQGKVYLLEKPSSDLIFTNESKICFGLPTLTNTDATGFINLTRDNFGKSYSFIHDDTAGMWYFYIGEDYYTIKDFDSSTPAGNVEVKHYKKYLSLDNSDTYTPTTDYQPATKKYVDDHTFDKNYYSLTNRPTIPSISGLATEEYVNNKTSKRNIIFDANLNSSDGVLDTYYTDCPVSNGAGSYVFDISIDISSTSNSYYLLIDNTDLYSPEDSTYDSANNAWIYPSKQGKDEDIIFICNKYGDQNKLILPWESAGYCGNIKVFTQMDLQNVAFTSNYNDLINQPTIPSFSNKEVLDTITAEKVAQWDSNTGSGGGTTSGINMVTISQSDYEALETKDPNTLYLITTTNAGEINTASNDITLSDDLPAGTYTLKYEDENNQPLEGFDEITTMEVQ